MIMEKILQCLFRRTLIHFRGLVKPAFNRNNI